MKKPKKPAVKVHPDGREVINLTCAEGRRIYLERIREMAVRQGLQCCLYGYAPMCRRHLSIIGTVFEHEEGRGMNGGHRDDRIWKDGKPYNGAAHFECNAWKMSRRIDYNHRIEGGERN